MAAPTANFKPNVKVVPVATVISRLIQNMKNRGEKLHFWCD